MSRHGLSDSEDLLGAMASGSGPALGKDAQKQTVAGGIALTPGAMSPGARYKYGLPRVEDNSHELKMKTMQAE